MNKQTKGANVNTKMTTLWLLAAGMLCVNLSVNAQTGYYSMQHPEWPVLPCSCYGLPTHWLSNSVYGTFYAIEDLDFDYDAHSENDLNQMMESSESESSSFGESFGPNDLWIQITGVDTTNNLAYLTLHGTVENDFYQLLSKTNLNQPGPAKLEQIRQGLPDTNQTDFSPTPTFGKPSRFYWAHHANAVISIERLEDAIEPTNGIGGQDGLFRINNNGSEAATVRYLISGSAVNGIDYVDATTGTNVSDVIAVQPFSAEAIVVHPLQDDLIEFDENLTLTLVRTNTYLIKAGEDSATILVSDNFPTNLWTIVATNLNVPVGIDYHEPTNALIVSVNHPDGLPGNFLRIYLEGTNTVVTNWSGVLGAPDEVKLATVKATAAGFTNGDLYFGNDNAIGWLSADGTVSNLNWCTLTNEIVTNALFLRGSLYVDRTGIFSNNVIAVTSDGPPAPGEKGVWRVDSNGQPILLTNLDTPHLEGVITLPNDVARWGPWAGKIITGDETFTNEDVAMPLIYSIDTNGTVASYFLDHYPAEIHPEDFDIIAPNQDLYGCDPTIGAIVKLSSTLLTNYIGDLLITDAGEIPTPVPQEPPKVFIVHWDGTNFVTRSISYRVGFSLEHFTFAPIQLPNL